MEEIDFPIDYTDDIGEIYFTYLKRGLYGDYDPGRNNVIRLACNRDKMDVLFQTFVHEVGHHVDEMEGFSDRWELQDEFDAASEAMPKSLALLFDNRPCGMIGEARYCEYFALGFELYYSHECGLNEGFPILYGIINDYHKRIK